MIRDSGSTRLLARKPADRARSRRSLLVARCRLSPAPASKPEFVRQQGDRRRSETQQALAPGYLSSACKAEQTTRQHRPSRIPTRRREAMPIEASGEKRLGKAIRAREATRT